jgi:hypothetical protein
LAWRAVGSGDPESVNESISPLGAKDAEHSGESAPARL